ncbi:MAG: hypothetical protein IRY85_13825 [Micromonosporaceae bacterium]|nr:hypothetical protein [Micromonosporaceae bacterium]
MRKVLGRTAYGLVAVVVLLGTINLGMWLKTYSDDVDAAQRPFIVEADVGQPARGRTFVATALEVRGAKVIRDSGIDHATNGVWLIVKVRLTALDQPVHVGYAAVRDSAGRVYHASNRVNQPLVLGHVLQPNLPVVGEIAFEVPRDAAVSLTVELAENPTDLRMDSLLRLRLDPLRSDVVDGWADDPQPATLMATELAV